MAITKLKETEYDFATTGDMTTGTDTTKPANAAGVAAAIPALLPAASETSIGGVERATDAEVSTGTDTTRYVSPAQLSLYARKSSSFSGTRDLALASSSVTYAHGLGRIPNALTFCAGGFSTAPGGYSNGFVGINNGSVSNQSATYVGNAATFGNVFGTSVNAVYVVDSIGRGASGSVTAVDATNVTISWTKISTPSSGTLYFSCLAQ